MEQSVELQAMCVVCVKYTQDIFGAVVPSNQSSENGEEKVDSNTSAISTIELHFSFLEIYNEEVKDLLDPTSGPLSLRENMQVRRSCES